METIKNMLLGMSLVAFILYFGQAIYLVTRAPTEAIACVFIAYVFAKITKNLS